MKTKSQELAEERATILTGAQRIVESAKSAERDLSSDEVASLKAATDRIGEIDKASAEFKSSADLLSRIASLGGSGDAPEENGGNLFSEADAAGLVKAAKSKTSFGTTVSYKAAMVEGSGLLPSVGQTVLPALEPKAGTSLRSLMSVQAASGPTVRYYTMTNPDPTDVAIVAEGGLKPESEVSYTAVDKALIKLATRFSVTDELAEDAPFLMTEIQRSVLRNVLVRENKLVTDTIDTTSGILTATATAATFLSTLSSKVADAEAANGLTPTALVVNPVQMGTLRNLQGSGDGQYLFDPTRVGPPVVFGVPIVTTPAVAAGTAYLLTSGFGVFYTLGTLRVEAGFTGDDWIYNRMTIRAEERVLPVVNRPTLVTKFTVTS